MANSSGRKYANLEKLGAQYDMLKCRFEETSAVDSLQKWTMFFHKKNLYSDISYVLHLAMCCFVKIQLEATAKTIGSVINNHGCKNRSSLLPKTLSNEMQVAWNGPSEFSHLTKSLIKESLDNYFKKSQTGQDSP